MKPERALNIALNISKIYLKFFLIEIWLYLISFPIIIILRIIFSFYPIRIAPCRSSVIGNSIAYLDLYLLNKKNEKKKYFDIFYLTKKPVCNLQFLKFVSRNIKYNFLVKYLFRVNNIIPGGKKLKIDIIHSAPNTDPDKIIYKSSPTLNFSKDEINRGNKIFSDLKIKKNEKYICLLVRDDMFKKITNKNLDLSYHNFRNSNIDDYIDTVREFNNRGYKVIRMGNIVEKKMNYLNENFIEYASWSKKDDFADIWLMANCYFCITTISGLDEVCVAFRKPLVQVNFLPLEAMRPFAKGISIFKKLKFKTGDFLSLKEINDLKLINQWKVKEFEQKNVDIINNTPNEIKEAAIEMDDRLKKKWTIKESETHLQKKYWKILFNFTRFKKYFWLNDDFKISTNFLKQNESWLFKDGKN
jgi:putative glycosyltransferase (TIGR04372 family)